MNLITIEDLDLFGKRVLIRSDFNVSIKDGRIVSDIRIRSSLPTIEIALKKGASVMVTSHLGRPIEGEYDDAFSLEPIVKYLQASVCFQGRKIRLIKDYLDGFEISSGELVVLENVRFNRGEKKNDDVLAKKYAALCDVFVMDAFGAAHREQASTCGIAKFAAISCIGYLFFNEIKTLSTVLNHPKHPVVSIVGGSKVSTKLTVLESLSKISDFLVVGGGIANTFIAAQGNNVGKSLYEEELIPTALQLLRNCDIPVPVDVLVSTEFSETACGILKSVRDVQDDEQILDLGNNSIDSIVEIIKKAKTIIWNGPLGVFEFPNFCRGTKVISKAIAHSHAFSIAGGGDTLIAIELFDIFNKISYISTGGGAFLEFIEGKKLPIISILQNK